MQGSFCWTVHCCIIVPRSAKILFFLREVLTLVRDGTQLGRRVPALHRKSAASIFMISHFNMEAKRRQTFLPTL